MNLDELEQGLIQAARRDLGPSLADRERHQLMLSAQLGQAADEPASPLTNADAGAHQWRALGSGVAPAGASVSRGLRVKLLGAGLVVGAVIGGWVQTHDLNEVLRAAHDVLHPPPAATPGGRAPKGPDMPDIYEALGVGGVISRAAGRKLRAVNRVRNDYTHRYPTATPEQIHGAIDALQQVSRLVIPAVVEWLHSQGYGFPGAPAPASPADTSP